MGMRPNIALGFGEFWRELPQTNNNEHAICKASATQHWIRMAPTEAMRSKPWQSCDTSFLLRIGLRSSNSQKACQAQESLMFVGCWLCMRILSRLTHW